MLVEVKPQNESKPFLAHDIRGIMAHDQMPRVKRHYIGRKKNLRILTTYQYS